VGWVWGYVGAVSDCSYSGGVVSRVGVLMITVAGTYLAWTAGSLPQWSLEKLSCRRNSFKNFALMSGDGSRDIMVELGRTLVKPSPLSSLTPTLTTFKAN